MFKFISDLFFIFVKHITVIDDELRIIFSLLRSKYSRTTVDNKRTDDRKYLGSSQMTTGNKTRHYSSSKPSKRGIHSVLVLWMLVENILYNPWQQGHVKDLVLLVEFILHPASYVFLEHIYIYGIFKSLETAFKTSAILTVKKVL